MKYKNIYTISKDGKDCRSYEEMFDSKDEVIANIKKGIIKENNDYHSIVYHLDGSISYALEIKYISSVVTCKGVATPVIEAKETPDKYIINDPAIVKFLKEHCNRYTTTEKDYMFISLPMIFTASEDGSIEVIQVKDCPPEIQLMIADSFNEANIKLKEHTTNTSREYINNLATPLDLVGDPEIAKWFNRMAEEDADACKKMNQHIIDTYLKSK